MLEADAASKIECAAADSTDEVRVRRSARS
jgi:hypothetical protein